MYFRARYIIRDFEFIDTEFSASDPAKNIDVVISKRPSDETRPALQPNQEIVTATCDRELPRRHHEQAVSSGILSVRTQSVRQVLDDLQEMVLHTLRLVRWRANSIKSSPNPIHSALDFRWSVNNTEWAAVTDNIHLAINMVLVPDWTDEAAEFVRTNVGRELDEPLGHELLREATVNRKNNNLRSSLVLAVAAAEVGFKQFAAKAFPETDWILENLPSPPLNKMLEVFPWRKLGPVINNRAPSVPASVENELKKAVNLRNQIVHAGGMKLTVEIVDSVLTSVRDLLYFLDALRGQQWATNHMSPTALKSFL